MMHRNHTKECYTPPARIRRIAGWIAVVAGIAMIVLPGPGLLSIALGMILLGRQDPTLRRWSIWLRWVLIRMSRSKHGPLCLLGRFLHARHRVSRHFVREQLHRHASGQPFSPLVHVFIGLTLLIMLASVGAGAVILIAE